MQFASPRSDAHPIDLSTIASAKAEAFDEEFDPIAPLSNEIWRVSLRTVSCSDPSIAPLVTTNMTQVSGLSLTNESCNVSIDTLGNRTTYAYDRFGNIQIPRRSIKTGNTALLSSVPTSASINFIKKSSSRSRRLNKNLAAMVCILMTSCGCASERLYVKVVDYEGHPVSNATVCVGFSTSYVLFGGDNTGGGSGGDAVACTDTNGNAVVKFNCKSSDFGWYVEADGYYRSDIRTEHFKGEDIIIPPTFGFVKLHEHEKHGETVLYRKKNPQPMYAYTREMNVKSPVANGRYGFDLECFDWLPPHGNGKVADFYYVRERPDETNMTKRIRYNQSGYYQFRNGEAGYPRLGEVVGRIEFDANCGAYIDKQTGCESFPSTHRADVRREYVSSIPITIVFCDQFQVWVYESTVVSGNEYMVIRSRVKCDENGNIISANYSKILGPAGFAGLINFKESVFNPRPNDTNLEFDPKKNLYKGKKGRGMIP